MKYILRLIYIVSLSSTFTFGSINVDANHLSSNSANSVVEILASSNDDTKKNRKKKKKKRNKKKKREKFKPEQLTVK